MAQLDREKCLMLLQKAGPVICYRTETEINGQDGKNIQKEAANTDQVRQLLGSLNPRYDRNIHGSRSDAYENIMGKLYDFGLRKGNSELDNRVQPFIDVLNGYHLLDDPQYMGKLYDSMIACFLAMTGYSEEEGIHRVLTDRLETIHNYVKYGDLSDFYIDHKGFKNIPTAFKEKKLVNPEYYTEDGLALPLIYDLLGFLHSIPLMKEPTTRSKIDKVIDIIFSAQYQNLPEGYGIVWKPPRKYYGMGWSIHIPLYKERSLTAYEFGRLLFYLEHFKKSEKIVNNKWYKDSIKYLNKFIGDDGVPMFPGKGMHEKKTGYWVTGARLGLEPGRRNRKTLRLESSFRYLLYTTSAFF
jgi:hypothetical protein